MNKAPVWPVVIFDLDGTLVDTVPLIVASYQQVLTSVLGRAWDETEIRSWIGRPLVRVFDELDPQRSTQLMQTYQAWNLAHTKQWIRGFPGVRELLQQLTEAGTHLAVATSKKRAASELALQLTGLTDLLPVLVSVEDTTAHKPDPEPLLVARARLDPPAGARAVYVGDAVMDLQAGQAAQFDTIAVTWGAGVAEELAAAAPTAVATSVGGLGSLLLPDRR